jgi:hypothetical protein
MKNVIYLIAFLFSVSLKAQDVSLALQKAPAKSLAQISSEWNNLPNQPQFSFASSNIHYQRDRVPQLQSIKSWSAKAWRGERLNIQLLTWTNEDIPHLTFQISNLKDDKGNIIPKQQLTVGFIDYVLTDEFKNGCGYRLAKDFDSAYVADLINTKDIARPIAKNSTQPLWLSIKVPENAQVGTYKGVLTFYTPQEVKLNFSIEVLPYLLPTPDKWQYDLDLWQHPASIARVHQVALWSNEHFDLMRQYYQMLANAGQKTITASIVNEPWGHQTYDDYPSLIKWTKLKDGKWKYDYSLFDKYISFVKSCGIKERINCYSMVPWKIAFTYFDEALNAEKVFTEAIGTDAYNEFWRNMLTDFTAHLKKKGWFDHTYIAMDERPMKAMQDVIKLLKSVDKDWKIALAGDYHPEIEKDIDNYCVASRWEFSDEVLKRRVADGKISTWYTCCTEPYPNAFTFSSPAESVWMGWYTASKNMDGYLRWAYNSWPKNPNQDSRFTAWPAGDTFLVYPGPLSSVRFEKMIEGIQDFEKINQLKRIYTKSKSYKKLAELQQALEMFNIKSLATTTADEMLMKVKPLLNN